MSTLADELLLEVLKACQEAAPTPLYPAVFAAYSGLERHLLDEALDHLRIRGLVRLTDWVRDKGQGYALTSEGAAVLQNPVILRRAAVPVANLEPPRQERSESAWERGEAVREILLNPGKPTVCMTLLSLNILMFVVGLVMALQQGASLEEYLGFGANNARVAAVRYELGALDPPIVIVTNQWWRLLAYAFVHGGLLHLGMNMYFLFSLGPLLETMWGSARFLYLYLVGALTGGCAVMLTMRSVVGASGALCGLLTSLGVWVYLNRSALPPNVVATWLRNVMTNLILMAIISTMPNISWEGHLGGALGGALVSMPLNYSRFGNAGQRIMGLIGMVAVPVCALGLVASHLPAVGEPLQARRALYVPFRDAEAKAATVYNEEAVPLLRNWDAGTDKAHLERARSAFQSAQQQLQDALQLFDGAGPYQEAAVADTVGNAKRYLTEWSKFYTLFAQTIVQPPPWDREQLRALTRQLDEISRARRPIANSSLLPSAYAEKDK